MVNVSNQQEPQTIPSSSLWNSSFFSYFFGKIVTLLPLKIGAKFHHDEISYDKGYQYSRLYIYIQLLWAP